VAAYDNKQLYCLQTTNVINLKSDVGQLTSLKYILGLLNSKLLNWFFRTSFPSNNHIASNQLLRLPVVAIDDCDVAGIKARRQMVKLVEQMLETHNRLSKAKTPTEKAAIQRQISTIDSRIDKMVYELYGLTDREKEVVEEGT
jgi:Na+/phosphate symporter